MQQRFASAPAALIRWSRIVAALFSLLALGDRAAAQSPLNLCTRFPTISPGHDSTIPANAAGVLFRLPLTEPMRTVGDFGIEVTGPDQMAIPTTAVDLGRDWYLIKPSRALVQGEHYLRFEKLLRRLASPARRHGF